MLLAAIIGSGIAAQRLSPHEVGLELLENAFATAAALVAIIATLGPISGAHLNPAVSLADRLLGGLSWGELAAYGPAQVLGGCFGAVIANLMFALPAVEVSTKVRSGGGLLLAEVVATFGLVLVIYGVVRSGRAGLAPFVAPTSRGRTGSRHRSALPTRPWRWRASSPTRSPESRPPPCSVSLSRSCWEPSLPWRRSGICGRGPRSPKARDSRLRSRASSPNLVGADGDAVWSTPTAALRSSLELRAIRCPLRPSGARNLGDTLSVSDGRRMVAKPLLCRPFLMDFEFNRPGG
ncbi:MAG: aquaporin [Candidatus Dormibacteraceae bacterium]